MAKKSQTGGFALTLIGFVPGIVAIGLSVLSVGHAAPMPEMQKQACLKKLPDEIKLTGGTTMMGSNHAYPEERPVRQIHVAAFSIDATEVTNQQFRTFVEATGYITDAERVQPGFAAAGGAVFTSPNATQPNWWVFVAGANWRHPEGPESSIIGRDNEPVVQITLNDARAYAKWVGRRLPTEEEWEYAARAGTTTEYVWGDEKNPEGMEMANIWQGVFPIHNTKADGFVRRSPVGCFAANGFGLYDMIGNVWEWTDTKWHERTPAPDKEPLYVIKGGSFLCAENFCRRYRASARQPQEAGLPASHIGFRTVK